MSDVTVVLFFLRFLYIEWFVAVQDTLDDIFDESGDEEEQDAIVNQVLDEIGIEISGKVRIEQYKFLIPPCDDELLL